MEVASARSEAQIGLNVDRLSSIGLEWLFTSFHVRRQAFLRWVDVEVVREQLLAF